MAADLSAVLIHTPCPALRDDRLEPPLGLLYLATWLSSRGYASEIVDLASDPSSAGLSEIPAADLYGFSTYTATYRETVEIMKALRRIRPQACMVAGGPHATALPVETRRDFDHVVAGEGERALLKIVRARESGRHIDPILREPVIRNLDSLPFPDYRLVDVGSYHRVVNGHRCLSILTSRGCPYGCVFCNSVVMGSSKHIRYRSPENVASEIREIRERWDIHAFRFQDDLFTLSTERLEDFVRCLRHEGIQYRCFGRVDRCSGRITDLLYESGCRHIAFGVESGSQRILDKMTKGQTVEDIRCAIRNAKNSGLRVRVFLLAGFPGENWDSINETVDLMLDCLPDEFSVYPVIPYPGTKLFKEPEKFGITYINRDFSQYLQVAKDRRSGYVFRTKDLDEDKLEAMRNHIIRNLAHAVCWAGDSLDYN